MRTFEIRFDFIDHQLRILTSDGKSQIIELKPRSVPSSIGSSKTLEELNLPVTIHMMPNEIENPILFDQDEEPRSYDREYAIGFGASCCRAIGCLKNSAPVCGKCSPVHFFGAALISR